MRLDIPKVVPHLMKQLEDHRSGAILSNLTANLECFTLQMRQSFLLFKTQMLCALRASPSLAHLLKQLDELRSGIPLTYS